MFYIKIFRMSKTWIPNNEDIPVDAKLNALVHGFKINLNCLDKFTANALSFNKREIDGVKTDVYPSFNKIKRCWDIKPITGLND